MKILARKSLTLTLWLKFQIFDKKSQNFQKKKINQQNKQTKTKQKQKQKQRQKTKTKKKKTQKTKTKQNKSKTKKKANKKNPLDTYIKLFWQIVGDFCSQIFFVLPLLKIFEPKTLFWLFLKKKKI